MSRINYDLSKIKAVVFDVDGVLSPSTIPMSPEGVPMRMANLKDGYAMQLAVKVGLKLAIISGADVPSIRGRFGVIGLTDIYLGASEKLPIFRKWLEANNLKPEEVAYVGDDIPDLPVMKACGLPVAPRDAATEVKAAAVFITGADGGYGVARELIEEILRVKGLWLSADKAFGW
ncbi:MAG: HAD hydrolase family protein [Muribaculaceae bacterium]|nr:HAD hydrolase family protein [Muribaculaceae bacterium]MDE6612482.1 HAD hydrolase family protein [Muribaculaceae bacterium]